MQRSSDVLSNIILVLDIIERAADAGMNVHCECSEILHLIEQYRHAIIMEIVPTLPPAPILRGPH